MSSSGSSARRSPKVKRKSSARSLVYEAEPAEGSVLRMLDPSTVAEGNPGSPGAGSTKRSSTASARQASSSMAGTPGRSATRRSSSHSITSKSATASPSAQPSATLPNMLELDDVDNNNSAAGEFSRMSREQLCALIVREREERQELEVRLEGLNGEHRQLNDQHSTLQSAQHLQEARMQEAYDAASRLEGELAQAVGSNEALRSKLRDAERDVRDANRRYRDQVDALDTERAAWHDTQAELEARVQRLQGDYSHLLEEHARSPTSASHESASMAIEPSHALTASSATLTPAMAAVQQDGSLPQPSPTLSIPHSALEEINALHTQLAESHAQQGDLSREIERLGAELDELQRLTADLQEQNENYEVLLSERMLALGGHLPFADVGPASSGSASGTAATGSGNSDHRSTRPTSVGSGSESGRSRPSSSLLDRLDEDPDEDETDDSAAEDGDEGDVELDVLESYGDGDTDSGAVAVRKSVIRTAKRSDATIGEGDGGVLDLETELSRAQAEEEKAQKAAQSQRKRKAKAQAEAVAMRRQENQSSRLGGRDGDPIPTDVEKLQNEVKLLRQENKGLTTYVSKILERVIGMEGFEKVLAVDRDYRQSPPLQATQSSRNQTSTGGPPVLPPRRTASGSSALRPSPLRAQSQKSQQPPQRSTPPVSPSTATGQPALLPAAAPTAPASATAKKNRFSMDFLSSALWRGSNSSSSTPAPSGTAAADSTNAASRRVSTANGVSPNPPALPGFKPMMLSAAAASPGGTSASAFAHRRMSIEEDDEDYKTRARLESEMKLLGLEKHGSPVLHGSSTFTTSPSAVRRTPSQRYSASLLQAGFASSTGSSPRPPSVPPKDGERSELAEARRASAAGADSSLGASPNAGAGSVKIGGGHRKRPSGGNRDSILGDASLSSSIGLGLSYSRDPTAPVKPRSASNAAVDRANFDLSDGLGSL